MAEANIEGERYSVVDGLQDHDARFRFRIGFYRLHRSQRTFDPLVYDTQCGTIPTRWEIRLNYELAPKEQVYTFSIVIKRTDPSDHRVKATFALSLCDAFTDDVFPDLTRSRDRMVHDDELRAEITGILPSELGKVVTVYVFLLVEYCHSERDRPSSKVCPIVDYDDNNMHLSKL